MFDDNTSSQKKWQYKNTFQVLPPATKLTNSETDVHHHEERDDHMPYMDSRAKLMILLTCVEAWCGANQIWQEFERNYCLEKGPSLEACFILPNSSWSPATIISIIARCNQGCFVLPNSPWSPATIIFIVQDAAKVILFFLIYHDLQPPSFP